MWANEEAVLVRSIEAVLQSGMDPNPLTLV